MPLVTDSAEYGSINFISLLNRFLLIFNEQIDRFSAETIKIGRNILLLYHIAEHPGTTMGYLSESLFIPRSSAKRKIDELKGLGLISRHRDERDKRNIVVNLTDYGKSIVESFNRHQMEAINFMCKDLSPDEFTFFYKIFKKIMNDHNFRLFYSTMKLDT